MPLTRRVRATSGPLRRALPRLAVATVALVVARTCDSATSALGLCLFVLTVVTGPGRWLRYVMTGEPALAPVDPTLRHPGAFAVELHDAGDRPFDVVKAVREVTGLPASEASAVTAHVPATVAAELSQTSATQVRDHLTRAGATATIVQPGR